MPVQDRFQRKAVCDGLGGALGLEPSDLANKRSETTAMQAEHRTMVCHESARLDLDLSGLELTSIPKNLQLVAPWIQELDMSGSRLTCGTLLFIIYTDNKAESRNIL